MDIARLLNRDDSEESDDELVVYSPETPQQRSGTPPLPSVTAAPPPDADVTPALPQQRFETPAVPTQRAVARPRPKRPRKPSNASLRAQVEAFQFVVENLPYVLRDLDDTSSSTSTVNSMDSEEEDDAVIAVDEDAQRMRSFLKRTIMLSRQAQEEIAKRTEYLRMLKRHYEGTANLHKLMRGVELDKWFWMCERWRALALKHYQPLSEDRCYAIMQETIQAIKSYKLPKGTKESGAFGWQDSVRLDDDQRYVRFMTRKTLDTDMELVVEHAWSLYQNGETLKKAHFAENCELFLQIVQEISPDVMIVQRVEQYPDVPLTHAVALIFRVKTETGYMIVLRCIESPRLQGLMKADGLSLCGSFHWETFDGEQGEGQCSSTRFTVAGSIGSDNPTYARRWRDEILIALVRYEAQYLDTPILSIESSAEDNNNDTSVAVSEETSESLATS